MIFENKSSPEDDSHANEMISKEDDVREDFSFKGYEVVHGAFFSHLFEPSVKLVKAKVSVNSACLRKLPDTEYVQFLVNRDEKKMVVKPCREDEKDSFRWSSVGKDGKARPRVISCEPFFEKIVNLMGWDAEKRYSIMGKLIRTKTVSIFVFDLKEPESFTGRSKASYPEGWDESFGVEAEEHEKEGLVSFTEDSSVFYLEKEDKGRPDREVPDKEVPEATEVETDISDHIERRQPDV